MTIQIKLMEMAVVPFVSLRMVMYVQEAQAQTRIHVTQCVEMDLEQEVRYVMTRTQQTGTDALLHVEQ